MTKAEAIEKIKKLLALSSSSNEHEAAIAFQRAQAMMREHLVQNAELKEKEEQIIERKIAIHSLGLHRMYDGIIGLVPVVGQKFNTFGIVYPVVGYIAFVGYETDVELSEYLFLSLINQGKVGYKESLIQNGLTSGSSFWMGFGQTVMKRLNYNNKEEKVGEALIVFDKVKQWVKDQFGELSKIKNGDAITNSSALEHGHQTGATVSLGSGIKGQGQKQLS